MKPPKVPVAGQPQTPRGSSGEPPGPFLSPFPGEWWPGAEASLQVHVGSHSQNSRLPQTKQGPLTHIALPLKTISGWTGGSIG